MNSTFKCSVVFSLLVLTVASGCSTLAPPTSSTSPMNSTVDVAWDSLEEHRMPASQTLVAEILESHRAKLNDPKIKERSQALLGNIVGLWSTACYAQNNIFAKRTFEIRDLQISTHLQHFEDSACAKELSRMVVQSLKAQTFIERGVPGGFHINLDWTEATRTFESMESGRTRSFSSGRFPWFIGALSSTGDLYVYPRDANYPCRSFVEFNGEKWCHVMRKQN